MPRKKIKERVTLQDILDAINGSSTHMEERFQELLGGVRSLEGRVDAIKSSMATRNYVDRRFDQLDEKFDKLNGKVDRLVHVLRAKPVISEQDYKTVMA